MLPKPPACVGCPLYGDGKGFVPDEHVDGAVVTVLAQNPGADEEREARPMVGKTGYLLNNEFLPRAGLTRGLDVDVCNVLKCRWQRVGKRTNELPKGQLLDDAVKHCVAQHLRLKTEKVIAMGAVAMRALGYEGAISEWRGFLLPRREE